MSTSVREVAFLGVATAVCHKSKAEGRRQKEEGKRQKGHGSADAPTSYALLPERRCYQRALSAIFCQYAIEEVPASKRVLPARDRGMLSKR